MTTDLEALARVQLWASQLDPSDPLAIDLETVATRLMKAEARVAVLEKKYEPSVRVQIAGLKRTIAHHKKEIAWKHKDDVDHVVNSVLLQMAEKELAALTLQENDDETPR